MGWEGKREKYGKDEDNFFLFVVVVVVVVFVVVVVVVVGGLWVGAVLYVCAPCSCKPNHLSYHISFPSIPNHVTPN